MRQKPEEVLRNYVKAFESLDVDAVAAFYRLPCMLLTRHGPVVLSDADAACAAVRSLIGQAQSQGYRRTEVVDLEVRALGEGLAWIAGVFSRRNASGDEIARFGVAYTMLGEGDSWKIVVGVAHEAEPTRLRTRLPDQAQPSGSEGAR